MKEWSAWSVAAFVLVLVGSYAWTHRRPALDAVAVPAAVQAPATPSDPAEEDAQQMVAVTGPLADYMARQKPTVVETLRPIAYKPADTDHVGASPAVGTSIPLLRQTFSVAGVTNLPFDVPAHTSSPQVRGTYHSFVQQADGPASDDTANIEFFVMNRRQYADFLNGRPGEALFSADSAHDQEVNVSLPPSFDKPRTYYLVFRNNSPRQGKKVVQADFRLDF